VGDCFLNLQIPSNIAKLPDLLGKDSGSGQAALGLSVVRRTY